jgi:hypothetical protein
MNMTIDDVRRMPRRQPFEPFTISLGDGRALEAKNRDFVFLPERGGTFFVVSGETFDFVYLRNVSSLRSTGEMPAGGSPPKSNGTET